MDEINTTVSRRRFLQATGATGAVATVALGVPGTGFESTRAEAQAAPINPNTVVTKSICHQCPARCGIDVYTTDGRVHAIWGNTDHPIANGKLCPKGPLGVYILYDPDRWKGPMKRTNPKKGRNEDPGFVPISWDEALDTVAGRLNDLRDRGESHRFALMYGRGWGESDAGILKTFKHLYGSPNIGIGHSSMCSDGSEIAKQMLDGNRAYNAYDYKHTNYILMFGCGFLEAYRPYNNNMQVWGHIRGRKTPKTRVTAVDVHVNTTLAAADRGLLIKPGTDGALALAIAHVILTEGLWERSFVGDFADGVNRFVAGQTVEAAVLPEPVTDPATGMTVTPPAQGSGFVEKWVKGLVDWWNIELKDRTVDWAAEITDIPARDILATAREFGATRPAMAIFERGAHTHSNGIYNGMAIHTLNALVGSMYSVGGLLNQMPPSYGKLPVDEHDYLDDWAENGAWKDMPRIDKIGLEDGYMMAKNMLQEIGPNHLAGDPYKLDTAMFYLTNPIFSAPNGQVWEEAMKDVFVIDTSPFPSETGRFADLILPDHSYLERYQDAPTYPFEGWPMAQLRVPAIDPIYDTKYFGDVVYEIGKRIKGRTGEYYTARGDSVALLTALAEGFRADPGDNGVTDFDSWVEKGVWYKKPYIYRQVNGTFLKWDGQDYRIEMTDEEVKEKLFKTPSGKFEIRSSLMEKNADWIAARTGRDKARLMFPIWEEPQHPGGGDLHLVTPKLALHAEGRGSNLPMVHAQIQPTQGGRGQVFMEINPVTARARGIADGDRVKISSEVGVVEANCRYYEGVRPDTVVLPYEFGHWGSGRWASASTTGHTGYCTVNQSDRVTGMCNYYTSKVNVTKA